MVLVGIMMMTGGVREFDLSKLGTVVPTILMLVITIIMHDLLLGLAAACFLHTLIALKPGTTEKITPMLLTLDAVFILYIALAETIR
jgi:AGZA family xanthine/uracil permease-like MFS transporter